MNSLSFKYPRHTDFVADRVNFVKPFTNIGIDYTGNFSVKLGDTTTKMYLLVITCLNVRAIHIEVVPSMSTKDFLLALVKFCNIYGMPDAIYSDNAKTFIQAAEVLKRSFNDDEVTSFLQQTCIKYRRIPLYSAWIGAAWFFYTD